MGSKMMMTSISMTESKMMMMMTFILRMNFTYELVLADDFGHKQARSEGVENLFTQSVHKHRGGRGRGGAQWANPEPES